MAVLGRILLNKKRAKITAKRTGYLSLAAFMAVSFLIFAFKDYQKAEALDTAKMILFWDGGSAPAGWTDISSTYVGKYPRGEAPASVLQTGGSTTHTPSISNTTINNNYITLTATNLGGTINTNTHAHSLSSAVTVGSANNDFSHRTLKIIQYDGIPSQIPQGAIALFDADGVPSGWTRQSAQDNLMIKIGTSVGTGGSDTHNHPLTWPSLTQVAAQAAVNGSGTPVSVGNHTHNTPSNSNTSDSCSSGSGCLPKHIKPLLAKADNNTSLPDGMIAMFDANPGGGWAVQSNPGGIFYQQFLRPASTFDGNSSGSDTHSHSNVTSGSYTCLACGSFTSNAGAAGAGTDHTHTVTASFTAGTSNAPEYVNFVIAKKSLPSMMMFWDGSDGSIPSGWSKVNDYNGLFPRGESPGNFGDTGGASTHSHTKSSVGVGAPSAERGTGISANVSSTGHTHATTSVTATTDAVSSIPRYRSLKLIKYDAGIPNVIPAGAMTIFDSSPGLPASGWTRVSAQDDLYLRVDSTVSSNSSGAHTHQVTWGGSIGAGSGQINGNCIIFCNANTASIAHTHTLSAGAVTSTSTQNEPPNVAPLLAKADTDTATLSTGLTAMFTGDPGSGWVIHSSTGGKYHKRFLLPKATYAEPVDLNDFCATGFGCTYHSHTADRTTGAASGTANDNGGAAGSAAAAHTHVLTAQFYPTGGDPLQSSNDDYFLPPYFNVIIAEKVDFKLEAYRWFDDTDNEDVTSGWSTLDVPINTAIPTLPTAYGPPDRSSELRLRLRILVNNNALNVGDINYVLQYKAGTDSSCTTGSWQDVGEENTGEIWRYASSGVTDGATLSTARISSDVVQRYAKSNPTGTNVNSVPAGDTMEWDFHIQHNGAASATWYSFRIVEDDGNPDAGILLSEYTECPTLVTRPQTGDQLRHGNFFESNGQERGFSWVD